MKYGQKGLYKKVKVNAKEVLEEAARNVEAGEKGMIADIYISISMGTFGHRKYKSRGEDGNK